MQPPIGEFQFEGIVKTTKKERVGQGNEPSQLYFKVSTAELVVFRAEEK
jgi:hypothetical protein